MISEGSKRLLNSILLIHMCGNNFSAWKGMINWKFSLVGSCWEGGRRMGLGVQKELIKYFLKKIHDLQKAKFDKLIFFILFFRFPYYY